MTSPTVDADVAAAKAGDHAAFERAVAPHRTELHRHCYRMTGSLDDADDLLQETLFRAWRGLGTYAGRSSFRAWLYRIATNRSIDVLGGTARREQVTDWQGDEQGLEPMWLQPYPTQTDPVAAAERREDLSLAFVVAIQRLSPLQRAVLLLRDVLGFSIAETAAALETSEAATNSALQRARANPALANAKEHRAPPEVSGEETALRDRLIAAWHTADVDEFAAVLSADVVLTMPPEPIRVDGRAAAIEFMFAIPELVIGDPARTRLLPAAANRQATIALYNAEADGTLRPFTILVLDVEGGVLRHLIAFRVAQHFSRYGLPATPPPLPTT